MKKQSNPDDLLTPILRRLSKEALINETIKYYHAAEQAQGDLARIKGSIPFSKSRNEEMMKSIRIVSRGLDKMEHLIHENNMKELDQFIRERKGRPAKTLRAVK